MRLIKNLILILQGKGSPNAIAAGLALGAMLGFIPKGNLFGLFFFLLFFLTTVNKSAAIVSAFLFTPIGFLLDSPAHKIGYKLLVETPGLTPLWTSLYNMPIIPWTKFNNTVVLGQFLFGLIFFVPLFFVFKKLIVYYQTNLQTAVNKLKVVQMLKGLKIYQLWESLTS